MSILSDNYPKNYHESLVQVHDPYLYNEAQYLSLGACGRHRPKSVTFLPLSLFLLEGKLSQINAVLAPI